MRIPGREPSHNLLADGYEACAEFIARRIKSQAQAFHVHVDDVGGVRLAKTTEPRVRPLPDAWFVGTYPYKGLRVEFIEDDLLMRQREIAA